MSKIFPLSFRPGGQAQGLPNPQPDLTVPPAPENKRFRPPQSPPPKPHHQTSVWSVILHAIDIKSEVVQKRGGKWFHNLADANNEAWIMFQDRAYLVAGEEMVHQSWTSDGEVTLFGRKGHWALSCLVFRKEMETWMVGRDGESSRQLKDGKDDVDGEGTGKTWGYIS
ncbi:MAG: hypothetical protein LQ352_005228, partial [Teloschistes flavicans]